MGLLKRLRKKSRKSVEKFARNNRLSLEMLEPRVLLSAQYTVTNLGDMGGSFAAGMGINDQGQVAGYSKDAQSTTLAFSWEDGVMESTMDAYWVDDYSRAYDINSNGFIVGGADTTFSDERAVYYDPTISTLFNIQTANISTDYSSRAKGVNSQAPTPTIVGYYTDTTDTRHPFSWTSSTGMVSLNEAAGEANDVNDSNRVVGKMLTSTANGDYYHAGYWQSGVWIDIDASNTYGSSAIGVNNNGDIIGWQHTGQGSDWHAFIWTSTGGLETLGTLEGDYAGDSSDARAINAAGQVVGISDIYHMDDPSYPYRAFLYDDGEMLNLEDVTVNLGGWKLLAAEDINNSGQIVGWGRLNDSTMGFLLTPIDTELPTASLTSADDITDEGGTGYEFVLSYGDNVAIDLATLDDFDIRVTGPGGFDQAATLFEVDGDSNGTPLAATYEITPPAGSWQEVDNGIYTIEILADQVADTSGNYVAAGAVGQFSVDIITGGEPAVSGPRVLMHQPYVIAAGQLDSVEVTFDTIINASTFTTADVSLTGPDNASIMATGVTYVSAFTYRVEFSSQSAVGTYSLKIGPNIQDNLGNKMDQDEDTKNGEAVDDVYTGAVQVAPSGLVVASQLPTGEKTGKVSEIDIVFSKEIDPDTFTVGDVVLTGPGGAIGIDTIEQIDAFNYRMQFEAQNVAGAYVLSVGPNIETPAGKKLNQDGDDQDGEAGDDIYTGSFSIATSDLKIDSHKPNTHQDSGINYMEVTFSRAIDEDTFTTEDVQITGPDGAINVSSVSKVSSKVYKIIFPQQNDVGNYTVKVGPDIETIDAVVMNQDGDDTPGEYPGDIYTAVISVGQKETKTGFVITSTVTNEIHVTAGDKTGYIPLNMIYQNYGPYTDSCHVYYYLSSDANVDENDERFYAGNSIPSMVEVGESRRIGDSWQTPDSPGIYYMKAVIHGDEETWGDLITIYVEPSNYTPLIRISDLQANKTSVRAGEPFVWTMTVHNDGLVDYIKDSLDEKITGDVFKRAAYINRWVSSGISGTYEIDYIPAGGSVVATYIDTGKTPWGDSTEYDVRFISNLYSNVTNPYSDFTSERGTITSSVPKWPDGKPDLVATISATIPGLAMPGEEIAYSVTVTNQGIDASGKNYFILYRSKDANVDRSDLAVIQEFLPDFIVPPLLPGQSVTLNGVMAAPYEQDTYYLSGKVDCGVRFYNRNDVNESNENNNWTGVLTLNVGNAQATADVTYPPIGENIDLLDLNDNDKRYVEVTYSHADPTSIDGNEIRLSGIGAGNASIGNMSKINDDTYRYEVKGDFQVGLVDVEIKANSFTNNSDDSNTAETESFGALPDLSPLQISVDTKIFNWDAAKKQFQYSGTFGIGLKPPEGQQFNPIIAADGNIGFDGNKINFSGLISMELYGQETTLFEGDFEFDVGSMVTSTLTDAAGHLPNEFTVAGTEIKLTKIEFAIPEDKTVADTQLELQGSVKLPEDMGGFELSIAEPYKLIVSPTAGVSLSGGKLTLPDLEIFMFGGELKMIAKDMSIEYIAEVTTPKSVPAALRFRGSVSLPYFYNATANFTGDDSYIEVTRLGGVDWYGTLSVEDIIIVPGQWEINKALLGMKKDNKDNYITECEAKMTLPTGIALGGKIHFINGDINFLELEADNVNKPLGATGAFLQRIMGHVDHLSEYEEPKQPVSFGGSVGITAGPQITVPLPSWVGLGDKVEGVLVGLDLSADVDENHLTGHGYVEIVSGLVQGNANVDVNWKHGSFTASMDLDALQGLITAEASLLIDYSEAFDTTDIFAAGKGAVKIPKVIPLWDGVELGSANMKLQYRDDNTDKNDYVMGWGKILVSEYHNYYLTGGIKVGFDGSYNFMGGKEIIKFTAPAPQAGATFFQLTQSEFLETSTESADYVVEPNTPWLLMGAEWENSNDNVTIEIVDPQGYVYAEDTFDSLDNIFIVDALSDAQGKSVYVHEPEQGTWSIRFISPEELTDLTISSMAQAELPEIEITDVDIDSRNQEVTIDYTSDSSDDDTVINFYYDTDNQNADGLQFVGDIVPTDNSLVTWDTADVPPGVYYVYAEIMDTTNAPVTVYWPEQIVIEDAPSGVEVPMGDGLARSVIYTDSDGTAVTVKLTKGQGSLSFTGENIETIESKKGIEVKGEQLTLAEVNLSDSNDKTSLTVTTKGGGIEGTTIGDITGGSLGKLTGKQLDLGGNIELTGSLGAVMIDDILEGVTITVGAGTAKGLSFKVDEIADNVTIEVEGVVKSLQANGFDSGLLKANSVGQIKINGDFGADVTLDGVDTTLKATLGTAKIAGNLIDSLWDITGHIGILSVTGTTDNSTIRSTGNVKSITLGASNSSDFLAGINENVQRHAAERSDFVNSSAKLKSFSIKGIKGSSERFFMDTTLSAGIFGKISLLNSDFDIGQSGIFAYDDPEGSKEIQSVKYKDTVTKESWSWPLKGNVLPSVQYEIIHFL